MKILALEHELPGITAEQFQQHAIAVVTLLGVVEIRYR